MGIGHRRVFCVVLGAGVAALSAQAQTADEFCQALMSFEEDVNKTLPRPVDEATELIQVKVNCETNAVSYTKRLLVGPDLLANGWQERKQRQYIQLHCNAEGLAFVNKWIATDVLLDPEYKYLLTLVATPEDCSY